MRRSVFQRQAMIGGYASSKSVILQAFDSLSEGEGRRYRRANGLERSLVNRSLSLIDVSPRNIFARWKLRGCSIFHSRNGFLIFISPSVIGGCLKLFRIPIVMENLRMS